MQVAVRRLGDKGEVDKGIVMNKRTFIKSPNGTASSSSVRCGLSSTTASSSLFLMEILWSSQLSTYQG